MKYISAEQFNQADKKVKDCLYNWWEKNINIGDLFESNITYGLGVVYDTEEQSIPTILGNTTPLLTVGQMIDFIETTTDGKVDIVSGVGTMKTLDCYIVEVYEINTTRCIETLAFKDYIDLTQALWKMCNVICNNE